MEKYFVAIGAVCLCAYYIYFMSFGIKNYLITRMRNWMIYRDEDFPNYKKVIQGDWDSLNNGKFFDNHPLICTVVKHFPMFLMPFAMLVFVAVLWHMHTTIDLNQLAMEKIAKIILLPSYVYASLCMFYHWIRLERYGHLAESEKFVKSTKEFLTTFV